MGRFASVLRDSAEKTDRQLASEISSLTRLTDTELKELFPKRADKENLLMLLEIVNKGTDGNKKVAQLTENISQLAGTVVKLLGILA